MWRQLLCFTLLQIARSTCPDGFELVRNGQCRGLYATTTNITDNQMWKTPVTKCKEIGALPVIIRDEEDQAYWTEIAATHEHLVLGIVCNFNTKQYEWGDGSKIDYKPSSDNTAFDMNCWNQCGFELLSDGSWFLSCSDEAHKDNFFCELPVPSDDSFCESIEDDSDDGVCYQIGTTAETWQDAQLICKSFGAQVASIHSLQENSFIRRLAVSKEQVTGLYLGATLSGKGNDFAWIDGSKWDYANFYPGFPMNGFGDCLVMDTESSAGQWVNVDCSTKLSVACQQDSIPTDCSAGPFQEGQIIYSPGFPFDASIPCDFILSVDEGKKVEVEVLLLEANSCCDTLVLFENYFGGTVVANLTGEVREKKFTTSSSNFMRVSWRPKGGVNVRGATFTYRGV